MLTTKSIKILDGQSIFDIAKQEYGNIECVWQLVKDNPGIGSINTTLVPGSIINIQKDKSKVPGYNKERQQYLFSRGAVPATDYTEPILPLANVVGWYKAWEVNSLTEEEGKNTIDNSEGITTLSRLYDFSGNGNHLVQGRKENQPGLVAFEGRNWADMFGDVHKLMEVAVSFPIPIYIAAIIRIEPDYGDSPRGFLIVTGESSGGTPQGIQVNSVGGIISMTSFLEPCGYTGMISYFNENKTSYILGKMESDSNSFLYVNGQDYSYNLPSGCNWHDGAYIKIGSSDDNYIPDAQILELAVFSEEPNLELLNNYFNWRR